MQLHTFNELKMCNGPQLVPVSLTRWRNRKWLCCLPLMGPQSDLPSLSQLQFSHRKCGSNIAIIFMLTGSLQCTLELRITIVLFCDLLEDGELCISSCCFVSILKSLVNEWIRALSSFTFVLNLLCDI